MRAFQLAATLTLAMILLGAAFPAGAELQTVQVGGELRIRGYYWHNAFNSTMATALVRPEVRWPGGFLPLRPIGDLLGGQTVMSYWDWDSDGNDYKYVEQRTRLNVKADFTDEVAAFIELDSYEIWGDDFRSNWITGADAGTPTTDDVEVYQAYIEANEMFGLPLRARIGRQELILGSGWLVGNADNSIEFSGISFDGIRLTYATDVFSVDAFWAKLAEGRVVEEDGDIDLYGIYASYLGLEDITIDAYWLWLRDARSLNDTNFIWFVEWLEDVFDLDDYDVTNLHTIGLRGAGVIGAVDFEAEVAYQFGDADQIGSMFVPLLYGDDDADFSAWAGSVEVGYTFDVNWQPRVYLGAAYFDGEDNRDISWWEWWWPFDQAEASVSFNRLFSNVSYSDFIDEIGELSNFWTVRGGVSASPTESVKVGLDVAYLATIETFDQPVHFRLGRFKIPIAPALSFWTEGTDSELGVEAGIWARYHYSADLVFEAGWSHLFVGDGLADGNYSDYNGLLLNGGTNDDDADYLYIESRLSF